MKTELLYKPDRNYKYKRPKIFLHTAMAYASEFLRVIYESPNRRIINKILSNWKKGIYSFPDIPNGKIKRQPEKVWFYISMKRYASEYNDIFEYFSGWFIDKLTRLQKKLRGK